MADYDVAMTIDMRFGTYGVRPAVILGEDPRPFQAGDTLDLVKFEDDDYHNYVIGRWRPGSEGYVFESIGDRMFTCLESYEVADIWDILGAVQHMLDDVYS